MLFRKLGLISLIGLLTACCSQPDASPTSTAVSKGLLWVKSLALSEASGMAAGSNTQSLWLHNDSGDDARIYRLNTHSAEVDQTVEIEFAEAVDWEDMAAFTHAGQRYLLLADIGDNRAYRDFLSLYAIKEPLVEQKTSQLAWRLDYSYPDGARDAEALAVDSQTQSIWILSKREQKPRLYRLALAPADAPVKAEFMAEINTLENDERPTAMDISADGQWLLIATYHFAYLFQKHAQGWAHALQQPPIKTALPGLPQIEAATFNSENNAFWIASEQLPTRLYKQPLPSQ